MVSEPLLNVLKLCLLALLYLFFLRVLRAVWVGVKNPALTSPETKPVKEHRHGRKHTPRELKIVAPPETAGQKFALGDELTVGRSAGCQVTIDDTFASQIHARVYHQDGQLYVEDLGSTNGTWLNREKVTGPLMMRRGDHLQVGNTVMEIA